MALREQSHDEYEDRRQEKQQLDDMRGQEDMRQHHRFRNQPQTWDQFWNESTPHSEREIGRAEIRGSLLLAARKSRGGWSGWQSTPGRIIAARELESEGVLVCNYVVSNKMPMVRVRFRPGYVEHLAS